MRGYSRYCIRWAVHCFVGLRGILWFCWCEFPPPVFLRPFVLGVYASLSRARASFQDRVGLCWSGEDETWSDVKVWMCVCVCVGTVADLALAC